MGHAAFPFLPGSGGSPLGTGALGPVPNLKSGTSEPGIHRPRRDQWWRGGGVPRRPFRTPGNAGVSPALLEDAGETPALPGKTGWVSTAASYTNVSYHE
jgi:hypothetical protein